MAEKKLKVGVIIPCYNEPTKNLLELFFCLIEQKSTDNLEFQVCVSINNSVKEFKENSVSYLQNQICVQVLNFLNNKGSFPDILSKKEKKTWEKLKEKKFEVLVLDSTSSSSVFLYKSVARARNLAVLALLEKFPQTEVLMFPDADTRYSKNFFYALQKAFVFGETEVFTGSLSAEALEPKHIESALLYNLYMGRKFSEKKQARPNSTDVFLVKNSGIEGRWLACIQNLILKTCLWKKIGGMNEQEMWDDFRFCRTVENLAKEIAFCPQAKVFSGFRPSFRIDRVHSAGWQMAMIDRNLCDYLVGKKSTLRIPERKTLQIILSEVFSVLENSSSLTCHSKILEQIFFIADQKFALRLGFKHKRAIERLVLKHFFAVGKRGLKWYYANEILKIVSTYVPKVDVTKEFVSQKRLWYSKNINSYK